MTGTVVSSCVLKSSLMGLNASLDSREFQTVWLVPKLAGSSYRFRKNAKDNIHLFGTIAPTQTLPNNSIILRWLDFFINIQYWLVSSNWNAIFSTSGHKRRFIPVTLQLFSHFKKAFHSREQLELLIITPLTNCATEYQSFIGKYAQRNNRKICTPLHTWAILYT